MYSGVAHIMAQPGMPDWLSMAAHSMRELMERLPVAVDLPADPKSGLFPRLDALEDAFGDATAQSECRREDGWGGTIDPPLERLLVRVGALVDERRTRVPSQRQSASELLQRLDPGPARPDDLRRDEARFWMDSRRFFERVSHHHHVFGDVEVDESSFGERVRAVEELLLTKLRPSAATDYEQIDALMTEYLEGGP
jgi:hypothetical protein